MIKYNMIKFIKRSIFKKLFITIGILAIYKALTLVVIPGIDMDGLNQFSSKSGFLETLNVFSGGSIDNCSILATNIMPYITATIITQMFCSQSIGLEYFQSLKKNREMGDMKKNEWTQYFTIFISVVNAYYISDSLMHTYKDGISVVFITPWLFYLISMFGMVAGSLFVVWLANQISKFGIGQGVSVIIFANIISNSASSFSKIYNLYSAGTLMTTQLISIIVFFLSLFFAVIYIEICNVSLPIKYSGIVGKSVDQKLPLKINNSGVMPAVLSSSLAHVPMMITGLFESIGLQTESMNKYATYFSQTGTFYYVIMAFLIFIFTTTQSEISFDPMEISQNLQDNGAIIRNVRPGDETYKLLKKILSKLNFLSAIYLVFVCVFSEYFCSFINQSVGEKILQLSGTAVLILVSTSKLIFDGIKQYNYEEVIDEIKVL